MKVKFCFAAIVVFVVSVSCAHGQNSHTGLDTVVEKLGNAFLKDKKGIGLSIGIYNNGKTFFYNFGSTNNSKLQPPTKSTVYEIGSITKTMVSFILANAVLENKVKLDDDIRKYLKGDYPNLAYNGNPIKLVHLANTTSLLPDWLPELPAEIKQLSADSALALKIKYYEKLKRDDFFTALHLVKLDTLPGTRRYHSNAAAQLLAYILEDIYGMPLGKLIKRYITTPYKLSNTSFINSKGMKHLARDIPPPTKMRCMNL